MSTGTIIAGFVVSTVGFSLFLFGKKNTRLPQLVAGVLMMVLPVAVTDPLWMSVVAAAVVLGLPVAIRFEQGA